MRDLPIYKIFVEASEMLAIALVEEPAIEKEFLLFNKESSLIEFNSEKRIISGPVMCPNQLIYRNDSMGERYVYYDEETVAESAKLFLKNGMKFNIHHSDRIVNLDVLESYLTDEDSKFSVPVGSWVISAKVNEDIIWEAIKDGVFTGFSFQSLFVNQLINQFNKQEEMSLRDKFIKVLDKVLFEVEAPVEEVETPEAEETNTEDKLAEFKDLLLAEIDSRLEVIVNQVKGLSEKVEEFSKQPTTESVLTEKAANVNVDKSIKAAEYFKN